MIAAEILAIMLKKCDTVKQLNVMGCQLAVRQLPDDTTLFLKN